MPIHGTLWKIGEINRARAGTRSRIVCWTIVFPVERLTLPETGNPLGSGESRDTVRRPPREGSGESRTSPCRWSSALEIVPKNVEVEVGGSLRSPRP
jgi:hypothetical protein